MTRTTTYLLGIIFTILVGTYFYTMCCSSCGTAIEKPVKEAIVPAAPKPTSYPFAFSDGDFAYKVNDNFNFNVSSYNYLEPLSQKVRDGIAPGLQQYLTENATKVIDITGYYKNDETNNSAYPNLGIARANAVKNYFVSQGISSTHINTYGKLMAEMVPKDNVYFGPVAYGISNKSADAEDAIKALYEKIESDPLVLYFDTAEATINLTAEQRQKFAEISRYLDKVPYAQCEIIGYADNEGKPITNKKLGQERADFAKTYLMGRSHISDSRIHTASKGESDPIASNDTEEGRARNRRTVISIK